jgi:hypothetical protein
VNATNLPLFSEQQEEIEEQRIIAKKSMKKSWILRRTKLNNDESLNSVSESSSLKGASAGR